MNDHDKRGLRGWVMILGLGVLLGGGACLGNPDDAGTDPGAESGSQDVQTTTGALQKSGGGGGGKCQVTDGPYTGKGGTYDEDGWCCFTTSTQNVCVECSPGRCKDASVVKLPIYRAPVGSISSATLGN